MLYYLKQIINKIIEKNNENKKKNLIIKINIYFLPIENYIYFLHMENYI